ncbi:kelch repeat and BTB domain-containing protein 13 [Amia ocellicauda]|uniref:kelch repeat and BTB domain-containing protein 13 n=1 Tax=Amia ocellicauda TaxID=2972642 RepID=UPI003464B22E
MASLKLRVGDIIFSVDKTLLTENCEYFRALFQSGMIECQQEEIHLRGLSARGFLITLAVLGGERPILTCDDIIEAIECAAFLQVPSLAKHLINLINSNNCIVMYHTAATFGLMDLYHSSALFIRDMYSDLEEDLRCLPEELVEYILSLMPTTFVAVASHSPTNQLLQDSSRTLCYLDEEEKEWKVLTDLPVEASTSMAGVSVLDNKLYIVGGVRGVNKQVVDSCFCYNALTDSWSKFSSPQQLRYSLTLIGHGDHLYAIGGEYERRIISSVEKYQVSVDTWSFTSRLPRPAASPACAKAMGRIFVCLWKPMDTTDIYEFDVGKEEWFLATTLIREQSYGHCMVAHRDNLYVMRNGPSDDFLRCMIDCYNTTTGQWTALAGQYVNSKGALFTATVRGDSVFTVNRMLTLVYSIEENKWKPRKEMKGFPRSGSMQTFLLRLPTNSSQLTCKCILKERDHNVENVNV